MKNCFTYAFGMWLKTGGYLMIRKSEFIKEFPNASRWHPAHLIPHFLHRSDDRVVTQYKPINAGPPSAFRKWLRLWHFEGKVVGDDDVGQ